MNRYNRNKKYDETKKKTLWLIPVAILLAFSLYNYGSLNLAFSCLIALLSLGVIALVVQISLGINLKLLKTRFGEYDKTINSRKYNFALSFCFVALILNVW
ncbi:hypothetical protein SAMN05660429_02964 [Thalassotalea agarivorans]|uniref:Uncharacterized protein n=1 Tax=Thalassotalea agarivorans TaxID=349064 RepID=A0A1I0HWI8_THASX|nr:hypothetical protein SAMN05660429_02964 [Thalassotalea agarivorans]